MATEEFGRVGFKDTRWKGVASLAGIGLPALYHHFESKLHCLYVIMGEAFDISLRDITAAVAEPDFEAGTRAAIRSAMELSRSDVQRNRVAVAEQALLGAQRTGPREEEARLAVRATMAATEGVWADHLKRGMAAGLIPESDPRLLSRASLGLQASTWHWYAPDGPRSLPEVADAMIPLQLRLIGLRKD